MPLCRHRSARPPPRDCSGEPARHGTARRGGTRGPGGGRSPRHVRPGAGLRRPGGRGRRSGTLRGAPKSSREHPRGGRHRAPAPHPHSGSVRPQPCLSDPGPAGVAAPRVLKRFKGRGTGGAEISTGPGPECLPSVRGSAERSELRDSPPAHRGRSRRPSGSDSRPSGRSGSPAWTPGEAGGGSQGRGALPGQRAAPALRVPLLRLPGPLALGPPGSPRAALGFPGARPALAVGFVPRSRSRAAARSPGAPDRGAEGVRRWVPAPPPRRVPHQQMVLPPPHPRGCGAPTDRTWPGSALPQSALLRRGASGTGARSHGGRGPRAGRVKCPGGLRLLVGIRGLPGKRLLTERMSG
ncbi:collagen, type I, alpha 1b-like [Prinia subflava]|uniref:collagen, type I, alpha 1b-like n=1 Tax=Prinia subflava TaxID=208062 RepID=UPI002FDF86BF